MKLIKITVLILAIILFFQPILRADDTAEKKQRTEFKEESWTPKFESLKDTLEFLGSIIQVHSDLATRNLRFRRNLLEVLNPVDDLLKSLGENANPRKEIPTKLIGVKYSSTEDYEYDTEKVHAIKIDLLDTLETISLQKFNRLKEDIQRINTKDKEAVINFCNYSGNGDNYPRVISTEGRDLSLKHY